MAKSALILVEGISTMRLYVQAAQRLGLHPIILSADPTQYDYLAAAGSESIRVDTDNLNALIRECIRLREIYDIAGITTAQESVYATVGKLCNYFNLPGPNPTSIELCCDKFTQRQLLAEAGVPIPAYRLAGNAADIESAAAEIGLPVILKPAVGSGSCGVRLCRDADELAEHTTYLLGGEHIWESSPRILVEEFAKGPLYGLEIMGNEIIATAAAVFGPPPHFVLHEFTIPALLTNDQNKRIADVSADCLRALGLGWGPTNIEVRWTKRGPVVIEVNPRLPGVPTPQMVQLVYGIDLVTEHIKLVIGGVWDLRRKHSHAAAARILTPDRNGILEWIVGESRAAATTGVTEVKFYVAPNTPINCLDWIGYVIAASPTVAEAEEILQRAVELIEWSITSFPTLGEQEQSAATYRPDE
ncbi:acetyl-CoA carboxylase biotin carboxylase subunit family protein [Mesorhizobium sp.]|uniref:ATP-grasp domain-containing protein n=1 Tax=Mesorhizobium sp. TaxID=1871066 RepID=UPI000FD19DE6|nr:acetyl-CoA carboxylase biotin carboxylase subunit family protein [Mesorhizobium sp.]RUV95770.1 ATP-grasp domain-containing protein [Mesorhizobium sp. M5C.F.Ca.IN.020.14.1.1]RWI36153.1 MAG: ATP-grasp domain-containing protein [Mesorhizobium sp.]RWI63578.1 MAG: ATP-grasp domain-containing protein [Mesorhizobium sp.]RWJ22848.1 MAG: ATP-grasp domain-containing protein [Mesorhizobium sp.]TIQ70092.1 MAG: ATP-grasp domain-containing protein [Mesorhizobium sp.]